MDKDAYLDGLKIKKKLRRGEYITLPQMMGDVILAALRYATRTMIRRGYVALFNAKGWIWIQWVRALPPAPERKLLRAFNNKTCLCPHCTLNRNGWLFVSCWGGDHNIKTFIACITANTGFTCRMSDVIDLMMLLNVSIVDLDFHYTHPHYFLLEHIRLHIINYIYVENSVVGIGSRSEEVGELGRIVSDHIRKRAL